VNRPDRIPPRAVERRGEAGFSLVELLVTGLATSLLMVGVLAVLDFNSRVTRVQANTADMQQSLRIAQHEIVRMVRMAGRGGLPQADRVTAPFPNGLALAVTEVPISANLVTADGETRVLGGTDVLSVRGVFSTQIFQIDTAALTTVPVNNPTSGSLIVKAVTTRGIPQDLTPLKDAEAGEALIMVSLLDDQVYAVVEITSVTVNDPDVTVNFQTTGSARADAYLKLSPNGAFPPGMNQVIAAGILEEYRYYVREDRAIPGDDTSELMPKLSRARFFPGTSLPHGGTAANARVDIADNILDLQVALGFDSINLGSRADDADHLGDDDRIMETEDGTNDDWLFNSPADNAADPEWQTNPLPPLQFVRITTLARSDGRDFGYEAPAIDRIENQTYSATEGINERTQRMYRRRLLQTVVDLRNLF
jgi:hypothetical protein